MNPVALKGEVHARHQLSMTGQVRWEYFCPVCGWSSRLNTDRRKVVAAGLAHEETGTCGLHNSARLF